MITNFIILGLFGILIAYNIRDIINFKPKEEVLPINLEVDHTEQIKILMEDKSIDKIEGLLDTMIDRSAKQYIILTVTMDGEEKYINQTESEVMEAYIKKEVSKCLTPVMLDTLYLIYKKENLNEIIELKIRMYIISYVTRQNQPV